MKPQPQAKIFRTNKPQSNPPVQEMPCPEISPKTAESASGRSTTGLYNPHSIQGLWHKRKVRRGCSVAFCCMSHGFYTGAIGSRAFARYSEPLPFPIREMAVHLENHSRLANQPVPTGAANVADNATIQECPRRKAEGGGDKIFGKKFLLIIIISPYTFNVLPLFPRR